jgi:hypothetical protein
VKRCRVVRINETSINLAWQTTVLYHSPDTLLGTLTMAHGMLKAARLPLLELARRWLLLGDALELFVCATGGRDEHERAN